MSFQSLGDLEQVDTMQDQGVADYEFENVLERYTSQVWAGTGGGQFNNSMANFDLETALGDTESSFQSWAQNMTGATTNINEQFYNQIGGLNIDDDGYLEASSKALEQMTSNLDEATRLLGQQNKPIRTIGDLHKVYRKDKQKRERAIKSLQSGTVPGEKTTVSYRDPITGETVSHNLGSGLSAVNRVGERETDAQSKSFEWIQNRVQAQQNTYDDMVVGEDWIRENQLANMQQRTTQSGQTQYNVGQSTNQDIWLSESEAIARQQHFNPTAFQHTAFNEFFGGNDQTLQFFQYGSDQAQTTMLNVYDAFSRISSSTYGNLYSAAFDTVGQSLLTSELTGKSMGETNTLLEDQAYKAAQQQKSLRASIEDSTTLFHKTKGKLRKKRTTPKARFKGFREDTPQ